jgi:hypothetical protein
MRKILNVECDDNHKINLVITQEGEWQMHYDVVWSKKSACYFYRRVAGTTSGDATKSKHILIRNFFKDNIECEYTWCSRCDDYINHDDICEHLHYDVMEGWCEDSEVTQHKALKYLRQILDNCIENMNRDTNKAADYATNFVRWLDENLEV